MLCSVWRRKWVSTYEDQMNVSLQMVGIGELWNIIRRCWMNSREGHLTVRCSSTFFASPVWADLVILLFIILICKSYAHLTDFQYWHTVDCTHYAWYRSRNSFGNFGRETSGPVVSPHCIAKQANLVYFTEIYCSGNSKMNRRLLMNAGCCTYVRYHKSHAHAYTIVKLQCEVYFSFFCCCCQFWVSHSDSDGNLSFL
jgi:hypothetical protein